MRLKHLAIIAVAALLSACGSKTQLPYFTDMQANVEGTLPALDYMPTIQPDDELFILVNSEAPMATAAYNQPSINPATRQQINTNTSARTMTYIVSSQGDIDFPKLGKIHVQGLTVEQLQKELTAMISKDVHNPLVTVELVNFKVVVAGEVKTPQTISVPNNRITVLEALAQAGDMTEFGERENVLVIREENGKRTYTHLDLNSSDVLNSPYYYLQQNDYVYVAPNKVRQANSKYNSNNAFKLSVISTVVSACSVVASLVIALTR